MYYESLTMSSVAAYGVCDKGRHYSGYTVYIGSLRVALNVDSDKFEAAITENSIAQYSCRWVRWHAAHGAWYT